MKQRPSQSGGYSHENERYYSGDEARYGAEGRTGAARSNSARDAYEPQAYSREAHHYVPEWPAYNDAAELLRAEQERYASEPRGEDRYREERARPETARQSHDAYGESGRYGQHAQDEGGRAYRADRTASQSGRSYERAYPEHEVVVHRSMGMGYGMIAERGAPQRDSLARPYPQTSAHYGQRATYAVGAEFHSSPELQGPFRGKGPKGYVRSDERIKEDLCECLSAEPTIDASDISVECSGGVVTLTGSVAERWMKHRVEDIADACSGVSDVRNQLSVSRRGPGDPSGV